jgi:hypothetical protein
MSPGGCLSALVEASVRIVAILIGVPLLLVALFYFIVFLFLAVIKYFELWSKIGPVGVLIGLLAPVILLYAASIYLAKKHD